MITNIDLHTHSNASDGIFTPAELVEKAALQGIKILSLTDHDTVNGIDEAFNKARETGITFIPGVEMSIDWPEGDFHLLGYRLDYQNPDLHDTLHEIKENREKRIQLIVEDLQKNGVKITLDDIIKQEEGASFGKPHVARALIKNGYGESFDDVFLNYMVEGKPGYVPKKKITMEMAFDLLLEAGGFPVLAHPRSLAMEPKRFEAFISDLVDQGLAGIECYSSIHNTEDVEYFKSIAEQYDLVITGGSDFHGDNKAELGFYGSERKISMTEKDFSVLIEG